MPWTHRLTPAALRCVVSLPSGNRTAMSTATLLNGIRYMSRLSPSAFDVRNMIGKALDFEGSLPGVKSPADMWADKSSSLKLPPPPNTWTGRRVVVHDGDLKSAFQQLNLRLRQNLVAKEIALTVRHEKKGDKRARLRSERWRKRFADAVRKRVQLVSTIRRRG